MVKNQRYENFILFLIIRGGPDPRKDIHLRKFPSEEILCMKWVGPEIP